MVKARLIRKLAIYIALLPSLAYFMLFWMVPVVYVALTSFTYRDSFLTVRPVYVGLRNYAYILESYRSAIYHSLIYSLGAAAIDLAIGYPLAYLLVKGRMPLKDVLRASLVFPYFGDLYVSYGLWNMFLPGGVFAYLLNLMGLSYRDVLYTPLAVSIGFAIFTLPFMVLYVASNLQEIDPVLEEVALTLGASPLQTFLKVTLPLSLPGAFAGFLASFGWNLGGYMIPLLLGGMKGSNVMTVWIVELTLGSYDYGAAASLSVILLTMTIVSTYLAFKLSRTLLIE